jgi:hypothetical protein
MDYLTSGRSEIQLGRTFNGKAQINKVYSKRSVTFHFREMTGELLSLRLVSKTECILGN